MSGRREERSFVRWAAAEGVSMVGSSVSSVVLPLLVYEVTGSAAQTGGLFALRVVPYLVFGPLAGPIADRGNRRRLIIGGNVAEGLLAATIPIAHLLGVLTVAQIYVVGLLSATAFVFSDAAVFGAVPALVGPSRVARANGFLGSLASAAEIIGPALGGALAAAVGPTNAIWIDAVSFLAAAAVQSTIRSNFRSGEQPASGSWEIGAQIRRAWRFVRSRRSVETLLLAGFGNSLSFGIVLGLAVPYAVERLELDRDDGRIGVLYSAGGVGSLIAGLFFARLFRTRRVRWITPSTMAVSAVAIAVLTVNRVFVIALIVLVVFSWAIGTTITVGITYRQLAAPDDLRSSVNVLGRMISWGGQPFGAGLGAVVAGIGSVRAAYVVAMVTMTTTALFAALRLPASTEIDGVD